MPKRDWLAATALGLVVGLAISLLFLVWAVPEFRDPLYQQVAHESANQQHGGEEREEPRQKPQWRFWAERLIGLEDTPAQWLMAFFALLATGISVYGIRLLKHTLDATREVGRDQSRAYLHVDAIDFLTGGGNTRPTVTAWIKNTGETPAKWFQLVGVVSLYPVDYTLPSAIETNDVGHDGVTWNALGGGDQLSAPVRITDAIADAINRAYRDRNKYMVLVSGFVRYETFFSEIFETEFMFVCRPIPSYRNKFTDRQIAGLQAGIAIRSSGEEPNPMQRAGRRLSSYKRIDQ